MRLARHCAHGSQVSQGGDRGRIMLTLISCDATAESDLEEEKAETEHDGGGSCESRTIDYCRVDVATTCASQRYLITFTLAKLQREYSNPETTRRKHYICNYFINVQLTQHVLASWIHGAIHILQIYRAERKKKKTLQTRAKLRNAWPNNVPHDHMIELNRSTGVYRPVRKRAAQGSSGRPR